MNESKNAAFPRSKILAVLVLMTAVFSSCAPEVPESTPTLPPSTATSTLTPSPKPSATPSATASATATPQTFAARVPVIEYHYSTYRIGDEYMMTTEWFQKQMEWLADNGYHTLTAAELDRFLDGGNVPARSVVITFDIGTAHRDDYTQAIIPALRKYQLHALIFVVTNVISDSCGEGNLVCWDDLRAWADEGLVSVESHGVYHPDYTTLSAEEQRWDALTSKTIIEEKIGRPVEGFAYPFDPQFDDDESAPRVIEAVGYRFALAGNTRIDRAVLQSDPDRFYLPRVYPYSNPQIYPVLHGSNGLTFAQLVQANTGLLSTPSPLTQTPTKVSPTPTLTNTLWKYYAQCQQVDDEQDALQRLYRLDQLAFPTDISAGAQARLAQPVLIRPSCNIMLGNQPRAIVLHATRGERDPSLNQFQEPASTSVHYLIDRNGQVFQMVPEGLASFHASCGGKRSQCLPVCPICEASDGSFREPYLQSIGIEMVNLGQIADTTKFIGLLYEDFLVSFGYRYWEDYPEEQLQSLRILVEDIRQRYGIPNGMVMGHYMINEKTDPGPALNLFWLRYGNPQRPPILPSPEP